MTALHAAALNLHVEVSQSVSQSVSHGGGSLLVLEGGTVNGAGWVVLWTGGAVDGFVAHILALALFCPHPK